MAWGEVLDPEPARGARSRLVPLRQARGQLPARLLPAANGPAVQVAAAAAGGFVAGAAMLGLVHRRQRRSALARALRQPRRIALRGGQGTGAGGDLLQIVGTRSLLVDVHLLAGPGGER